jgi:hypothetical protein
MVAMLAPAAYAAPQPEAGFTAFEPPWWGDNFAPRQALLGSVQEFAFYLVDPYAALAPFHQVDIWLQRPPTINGAGDVVWPFGDSTDPRQFGGWFMATGESEMRRQSWPTYATTNELGYYYAKFMLPRENTWYPCGYPCNWQCDFVDPIGGGTEYHSPYAIVPVYRIPLDNPDAIYWPLSYPLYWPNGDNRQDTFAPLVAFPTEGANADMMAFCDWVGPDPGDFDCSQYPYAFWAFGITGYYWKTTDLRMNWPADYPLLCDWQ